MYNINNKYIHLKMKSILLIPRLSLYLLRMKLDYNVSSEGITVLSEVYIIWTWTNGHGHGIGHGLDMDLDLDIDIDMHLCSLPG